MQGTVGICPLSVEEADIPRLLPMLCGTERAQAQVPAACLGVGDSQAAEGGRGIDGEQEACQGLCGHRELHVSRAGDSPFSWVELGQGQSTLC